MWPADDARVSGGQVWWWYVNCICATRSLSLYIIHTDAWKRSGGLIEVFAPYNAHYTQDETIAKSYEVKNSALFVIN